MNTCYTESLFSPEIFDWHMSVATRMLINVKMAYQQYIGINLNNNLQYRSDTYYTIMRTDMSVRQEPWKITTSRFYPGGEIFWCKRK